MGLDMYLRAKTTKRNYEGSTGCCSGMINVAPDDDGMVEIGYWRKAYDQRDLFRDIISSYDLSDDNCVDFKVMPNEIEEILSVAKHVLETHKFNEDGDDLDADNCYTFFCKQKWEDTIKFFTEAKKILEEDPDAEIYYCQWY